MILLKIPQVLKSGNKNINVQQKRTNNFKNILF